MSQKAVGVVVELHLRSVTCPGVFLPDKDDLYLTVCLMNQYKKSECLSPVFPLVFQEKMRFEKVFKHVNDPAAVAELLESETVKIELIQLIPPVGESLACVQDNIRSFLFPEPKLVPTFSGVDRGVLMTRAPTFPGIAPRIEFSTRTTIKECSARAGNDGYQDVPWRTMLKTMSGKSQLSGGRSLHRAGPSAVRKRAPRNRTYRTEKQAKPPLSRSLSPFGANLAEGSQKGTQRRAPLHPDAMRPRATRGDSRPELRVQHVNGIWPGGGQPFLSAPTLRESSSPQSAHPPPSADSRGSTKQSHSVSWAPGTKEYDPTSSDTDDPEDGLNPKVSPNPLCPVSPSPSTWWRSPRESRGTNGPHPGSGNIWEEVQERVRGLLTSSRAIHRIAHGATEREIVEVLARRSILQLPYHL